MNRDDLFVVLFTIATVITLWFLGTWLGELIEGVRA